jgi:hypothetical protein
MQNHSHISHISMLPMPAAAHASIVPMPANESIIPMQVFEAAEDPLGKAWNFIQRLDLGPLVIQGILLLGAAGMMARTVLRF